MSITLDNTLYNLISQPNFGSPMIHENKKIKFEAQGGAIQQRNSRPISHAIPTFQWNSMPQDELNLLLAWVDAIGSDSFWVVDPHTYGTGNEMCWHCKISEDGIHYNSYQYDGTSIRYRVQITFVEV